VFKKFKKVFKKVQKKFKKKFKKLQIVGREGGRVENCHSLNTVEGCRQKVVFVVN
jgi:hypothetical protein